MRKAVLLLGVAIVAVLAWLLLRGGGEQKEAPPAPPNRPVPAAPSKPAPAPEPAPVAPPGPAPPARSLTPEVPTPEAVPSGRLTVSGRVSFPDGRPVPGLDIVSSVSRRVHTTDADGRYVLPDLPPGKVEVEVTGADLKRTVEAGSADADFVLKEHVLQVEFVDEHGRQFERGDYSYSGELGSKRWIGAGVLAAGRGGFSVSLPVGTRIVYSGSAPGRLQVAGEYRVEGETAQHEIRVTLPLLGETGSLALHVQDDGGKPPRKVTVTIKDVAGGLLEGFYERGLDLDAEGKVLLEKVQPGTFVLKAGSGGPEDLENFALDTEVKVEIEAGKVRPLELLLKSGGWIRVTVRDRTGKVLKPSHPRLFDEEGEYVPGLFWGTDGKGRWSNPPQVPGPAYFGRPLPAGRYSVEVLRGPKRGDEKVVATAEALVAWRQITDVEVVVDPEEEPVGK